MVKSGKLGPGLLEFGDVGSPVDASCQATGVALNPDSSADDDLVTLCGDTVPGATKTTYKLAGTFMQDLQDPAGIVAFSWEHEDEVVPFTFTPSTAMGTTLTGMVRVTALAIGGDTAGDNMTSDFEWTCTERPTPVRTPDPGARRARDTAAA